MSAVPVITCNSCQKTNCNSPSLTAFRITYINVLSRLVLTRLSSSVVPFRLPSCSFILFNAPVRSLDCSNVGLYPPLFISIKQTKTYLCFVCLRIHVLFIHLFFSYFASISLGGVCGLLSTSLPTTTTPSPPHTRSLPLKSSQHT